jgi:hypothetical protein
MIPQIFGGTNSPPFAFIVRATFFSFRVSAMSNGAAVSAPQEKINVDIVTLTRFLTEEQTKHKEATGDFTYTFCHLRYSDKRTDEPY